MLALARQLRFPLCLFARSVLGVFMKKVVPILLGALVIATTSVAAIHGTVAGANHAAPNGITWGSIWVTAGRLPEAQGLMLLGSGLIVGAMLLRRRLFEGAK
jgi:hypothetical protein